MVLMKGIIYARQSKKEHEENSYSIPGQIDDMTKIAQARNIELPNEPITDPATRGKKIHRPGIDKLIREYIDDEEKKVDCILTTDIDRLGRNKTETFYFIGILSEVNVNIITRSRDYNIAKNPDDFIMAAIECRDAKRKVCRSGRGLRAGKERDSRTVCGSRVLFLRDMIKKWNGLMMAKRKKFAYVKTLRWCQ